MFTRGPAYFVAFLSGLAALLYQVIWHRLLVLLTGADAASTTMILTGFMAGLGLGSLVGGRLADRLERRHCLRAFAAAELLVGAFGLASTTLYADVLPSRLGHLAASPLALGFVVFVSLLIPTLLMGVSLPLLARAFTTDVHAVGRVVGALYGWNTLGAATGAFAATWVFLPAMGLERTLWLAALANAACAIAALSAQRHLIERSETAAPNAPASVATVSPEVTRDPSLPVWQWATIYALTGFIALGLEVAWFRLLGVMLKSTAFTFGTLLTIYLAGIGLGGVVAAGRVEHRARPGRTFLLVQYALIPYAGLSIAVLIACVGAGYPGELVRYLSEYEPVEIGWALKQFEGSPLGIGGVLRFMALYLLLPAALFGLPTFLMGYSFPFLQQAAQSDLTRLGARVGVLMAANVAGAVLGAAVTGRLLLPWFGTSGAIAALVAAGGLLAWPLGRLLQPASLSRRMMARLGAAGVTAAAAIAVPAGHDLWARLHGATREQTIVREDSNGVSLLKIGPDAKPRETIVFVNGLGQSMIPYIHIHALLGSLPVMIHPAPRHVAIIGLGSGATAFAAAGRDDVEQIVCIEIAGAQREALQQLALRHPSAELISLLSNPRITHVTGDGRTFLRRSEQMFDVIEADALRPTSAFAGHLYSREYFDLVRRRLAPGGLAVSWAPTQRIHDTFLSVFPHVLVLGEVLVGSDSAIPFDPKVVLARAASSREYYAAAGIDIVAVIAELIASPQVVGPETARRNTRLNTDLFPRDEFAIWP